MRQKSSIEVTAWSLELSTRPQNPLASTFLFYSSASQKATFQKLQTSKAVLGEFKQLQRWRSSAFLWKLVWRCSAFYRIPREITSRQGDQIYASAGMRFVHHPLRAHSPMACACAHLYDASFPHVTGPLHGHPQHRWGIEAR